MTSITQDMRFRLSLLNYAEKYGVTKAAVKYKVNRQYIYRWRRRFDGSIESLREHSRRPHHHPNQHTPEELKLIKDMRRRNPH
ncbi:MAG: helix-turn-helix domain-containing protein, partial [Emergencia sp.]|nr:helix-turn-helix domain-containing protein [Emergencia sp.]